MRGSTVKRNLSRAGQWVRQQITGKPISKTTLESSNGRTILKYAVGGAAAQKRKKLRSKKSAEKRKNSGKKAARRFHSQKGGDSDRSGGIQSPSAQGLGTNTHVASAAAEIIGGREVIRHATGLAPFSRRRRHIQTPSKG